MGDLIMGYEVGTAKVVGAGGFQVWKKVSYSDAVLADSPYAYWRLGDAVGATTVVDSSGNGRAGSATAGATMPTFGVAGAITGSDTAASLDGGDKITLPDIGLGDSGLAATIELWMKYSNTAVQTAYGEGSSAGTNPEFYLGTDASGKPQTIHRTDAVVTTTVTASSASNNGLWHHVVAVLDRGGDGKLHLWVDGTEVGTPATFGVGAITLNQAAIGCLPRTTDVSFFTGSLDEVAVYRSALSATRIQAHYNAR